MPPPFSIIFTFLPLPSLSLLLEIIPLNISCYFTFPLTRFYIQSRTFLLRRTDETLNFPICFLLVSSSLSSTSLIRYSFYFECKDKSFPFSTYAICAICVDSGNKVRKISWNHSEEYLRRIRNYLRKIAEYLRRIRNYLRKIAEYLRRINLEDKCW